MTQGQKSHSFASGFLKNSFQFTCFSNFIYYNVLYVICFKNVLLKEACFGHTQSRPQPELVGFAVIIFLWYDKPEAYFAKEGTDPHRIEDC